MKYKLTEETKTVYGITLYRIQALEDVCDDVKAGDLGGWVQSEKNLSQVYGNAWVYGNAQVHGNAQVYGDAQVHGNARVYGNAWVYGDAQVSGNARVYGNAQVYGNAWVYGDAQVSGNAWVQNHFDWLMIGPVGSRAAFTTFFRTENGIGVSCGCFDGTLEEFAARVEQAHGANKHGQAYRATIELVKQVMLGTGDE